MAANAVATKAAPAAGSFLEFWTTYGSVITGGAVIISAICAFTVILTNRAIAKRRGTLDMILHQESDAELIAAREEFTKLRAGNTKLSTYGVREKRSEPEAMTIRKILNLHELVAVAIREGVINQRVYRLWFNKSFITDYEDSKDYIVTVRKEWDNPALYKEFEDTALRWKADESWYAKPGWAVRKGKAIVGIFRA